MSLVHMQVLEDASKPYLRNYFRNKRKILLENNSKKSSLDLELESRLLMTEEYREAETILVYSARDFEIETVHIISAAFANGKTVALPRCEADGEMRFYRIRSLSDLETGSFGILEPKKGCAEVAVFSNALCVCPCLCADMRGYRVGFGKGYYDRFLRNYDGRSAVLCYSDALLPEIQTDEFDEKVQLIVTDAFVRRL